MFSGECCEFFIMMRYFMSMYFFLTALKESSNIFSCDPYQRYILSIIAMIHYNSIIFSYDPCIVCRQTYFVDGT